MIIKCKPSITKSKIQICQFHKRHPNKPYAGCTCSGEYWNEELNTNDLDILSDEALMAFEYYLNRFDDAWNEMAK